jgi:hypothetical protein
MTSSPRLALKSVSEPVLKEEVSIVEEIEPIVTKETPQPAVLEKDDTLISSIELNGATGPDAIRPQSTEPDWKPFDGVKQSMSFFVSK